MKKIINKIYIIIFMVMCFAPMVLFLISNIGSGKEKNTTEKPTIEKTVAAEFPKLINEKGINASFGDECETWVNQNIPYRGLILAKINLLLSDGMKNPTSNVIAGKDGWIYSVETEDDYMDTNAMTEEEIKALGCTLSLIQEKVKSSGGDFLFVPVPNKNTIYAEYMPSRYQKADTNNLMRVYDELENVGVSYIDLKQDLLLAKEEKAQERLYYKRDTHWTALGAAIGYESIMKKLGKNSVLDDTNSYKIELSKNGDLDKLLFPMMDRVDEEYILNKQIDCNSFEFISPLGVENTKQQLENFMSDREDHDNDFTTQKKKESGSGHLYMIRDSFGRALLPFLIDSYDKARFLRTSAPSFEGTCDGADVIYEICERNIRNIIHDAPFMYAPMRTDYVTKRYESEINTCICEDNGYAFKISGTIDTAMLGDDGHIYVRLVGEDNSSFLFEAFPIFKDTYGFCAYLDKSVLNESAYNIKIVSGAYESECLAVAKVASSFSEEEEDTEPVVIVTPNPYEEANANHQIVFRDTTIAIGDNINQLTNLLGDQTKPSEIVYSCLLGTDGMLYYYPNIVIETDMEGEICYISLIGEDAVDEKDIAATESGIAIGCELTEISKKLGRPVRETSKNCIYWEKPVKVTYSYKDGKVTSIILEKCDEMPVENQITEETSDNNEIIETNQESEIAKGWQVIDGDYVFYDRITGERIFGQTVDGIVIDDDGVVHLNDYDELKIETMIKAHNYLLEITSSTDTMEEKRKKAFDWILSFPYHRHRHLKDVYKEEGIEITEANDIFDLGSGDCVSESAALAFMFHEIGYENVYWVHDTGHSWVRCEDKLFDPLFAESKGYDANYNAPFTDYRSSMKYSLLIY